MIIITVPVALRTGRPIPLCLNCAAVCREVYALHQLGVPHTAYCAGCRKRRYVAEYVLQRKERTR